MSSAVTRAGRGFALSEVLVALLCLSLGLTSTVTVLVQGVRHERESAARSAALGLATTLGEELRTLRRPDGRAVLAAAGAAPAGRCADGPDSCRVEAAAAAVLAAWQAAVATRLPEGATALVEITDPAVARYRISIIWPAAGDAAASSVELVLET